MNNKTIDITSLFKEVTCFGKIFIKLRIKNFMTIIKKALIIPINDNNQILIQDRSNIKKAINIPWEYIGAEIERGETPVKACIREAEEKLGITVKAEELFYIGRFDDYVKEVNEKRERDVFVWKVDVDENEFNLQVSKEFKYFDIDHISSLMILEADKKIPEVVKSFLTDTYTIKIANKQNELLDVLVEGKNNAEKILIFAHGLGTDKDGGLNLFKDIAGAFKDRFKIIRFDFSAYGRSEGKEEDANIKKNSEDLETVIDFVKDNYKGELNLIAHSMGTFYTGRVNPEGFKNIILTGIPSHNPEFTAEMIAERIRTRENSILNMEGVSTYPRTSGAIQKIGKEFWKELRNAKPLVWFKELGSKANLTIIHPNQDEIISDLYLEGYKNQKEYTYIELEGDHNFSKKEDRLNLIDRLIDILS